MLFRSQSFPHYGPSQISSHIQWGIVPNFEKERQALMLIAQATIVGTNLYDFLMKILGSEVMRTVFSYLIRQALTRVGL